MELRPPRYKGTKAATSLEIGRSRKDAGELCRKDWTWGKEPIIGNRQRVQFNYPDLSHLLCVTLSSPTIHNPTVP